MSEITVTLPIKNYERLVAAKNEFDTLKKNLLNCLVTSSFDIGKDDTIYFSQKNAVEIIKKYIPLRYKDVKIEYLD